MSVLLTCCVKGMEVTRHYTPWQASQIVLITALATTVGLLLFVGKPLLESWRARD